MPDTCCCSPVPTIPKESGSRSGPDLIDRRNACTVVLPRVCHFAPFHMQCMGRGPTSTTPPTQRLRKHVSDCGLLGRLQSSTLAAIRTKPVALWSRLLFVLRNAGDFACVSRNHLDQIPPEDPTDTLGWRSRIPANTQQATVCNSWISLVGVLHTWL